MLPYSREVYFSIFGELNDRFIFVQILSLFLAHFIAFRLIHYKTIKQCIPLLILSALWAGNAYFWFYQIFAEINFLAHVYAVLAGTQSLTLAIFSLIPSSQKDLNPNKISSTILFILAILWPAIDLLTGPGWPFIRIASLHLIPLIFITQACLLYLPLRSAFWLSLMPFILSCVCAYEAYVLNIHQDWLPLLTACHTTYLLVQRKIKQKPEQSLNHVNHPIKTSQTHKNEP